MNYKVVKTMRYLVLISLVEHPPKFGANILDNIDLMGYTIFSDKYFEHVGLLRLFTNGPKSLGI